MKNIKLFLIIFLFFQLFNSYSQNQNIDSLENFYKFYDYKMNYFTNQAESLDVNYYEINGYKSFIRKVIFLQNRFDEFGNITPYAQSLQEYRENNHDNFPDVSLDWEYIGHNGIHLSTDTTFQCWNNGQGNINSIWVNVNDHNHLLAGGNHGGLWRTFDGGDNWVCISDSEPLLDGIRSLYVNSANTDQIYALQGNESYSHGLFTTSNGGANWINNKVNYNGNFLYPNASECNLPVKWIINPVNDSIQF